MEVVGRWSNLSEQGERLQTLVEMVPTGLDLTVVCEGVETAEQGREMTALTGDFSQGFHFSRPMTAEMVDDVSGPGLSGWTIAV